MKLICYLLLAAVSAKLIWNIALPIVALLNPARVIALHGENVSIAPVELILWGLLILVACTDTGAVELRSAAFVLIAGGAAIVASYLPMVLFSVLRKRAK